MPPVDPHAIASDIATSQVQVEATADVDLAHTALAQPQTLDDRADSEIRHTTTMGCELDAASDSRVVLARTDPGESARAERIKELMQLFDQQVEELLSILSEHPYMCPTAIPADQLSQRPPPIKRKARTACCAHCHNMR